LSFTYLAHPIDLAGESSWLGSFLGDLRAELVKAGVGAFQPGMAYVANTGDPTHAKSINALNNTAIYLCESLVAVLPKDIATLGTPVEISFALRQGKPVVIFTDITHSVQVSHWAAEGAVVYVIDEDFRFPESMELRAHLTPTRNPMDGYPVHLVDDGMPTATLELIKPGPLLVAGEAANLRTGKYPGDAGLDLCLNEDVTLAVGQYSLVGTGVHVAIPDGMFGLITGRSSTWAQFRCAVNQAVIDSGYRGELMVGIENRSNSPVMFEKGDRLAQIVLLPAWTGDVQEVADLPAHDRGHNGYGSSGR
jgi:dUTP pyrophosphatase